MNMENVKGVYSYVTGYCKWPWIKQCVVRILEEEKVR